MAGLGLRLATGDKLVINGAAIHFVTGADIRLANKARFLFGRQIMAPHEANTAARRIYYALQVAHVGEPDERAAALAEAALLIDMFSGETTSPTARRLLDEALRTAHCGNTYLALKIARRIIAHEDAVLSMARDTSTVS